MVVDNDHTYVDSWKHESLRPDTDLSKASDFGFARSFTDEPHMKRRQKILHDHPEIEQLRGGYEPMTKYFAVGLVVLQFTLAYGVSQGVFPWWGVLLLSYFVGGTAIQACAVIIHECCHGLAASELVVNRCIAMTANLPMVVPNAMTFRRLHLEHHVYQGVEDGRIIDADIPLQFEIPLIHNLKLRKFIWLLLYPVMYAVRGITRQNTAPQFWEIVNVSLQLAVDVVIVYTLGWYAFGYLCLSLIFGMGLHPCAAHFIQEHYVFADGQETYSYYGPLNKLTFNVGYHNEHHDFANVPWTKIKKIREIAPEYYDTLYYHMSWVKVLWDFINDNRLGTYSRVIRTRAAHDKGRSEARAIREGFKRHVEVSEVPMEGQSVTDKSE